jgi:hypothetical protein
MGSDPNTNQLVDRVARFIDDPAAEQGGFEALALAVFAHAYEHVPPYRRLCERRGARPGETTDVRAVPPVPTTAFKSLQVTSAAADDRDAVTFRSSGTRGGEAQRSVHRHPHPDLYRRTLDAAFPAFCPLAAARPPILALVPERAEAPDSSLAFMVDHLVSGFGGAGSAWAFGKRGVDGRALRSWIGARQRDGRPALVLATTFALADAVDTLERMGLRFRLPGGSAIMDTGGYKGHERRVERGELLGRVAQFLGVPAAAVFGEYGMTELTSQLYTRNLVDGPEGGAGALYAAPHWVRVRCLDPATLTDAADGEPGLVAIFDLANLGSAPYLLSEDLGRLEDGRLRLLGRAPGAELRGCSLAVEEMGG